MLFKIVVVLGGVKLTASHHHVMYHGFFPLAKSGMGVTSM